MYSPQHLSLHYTKNITQTQLNGPRRAAHTGTNSKNTMSQQRNKTTIST
jgi:hypothetical protein